MSRVVWNAVLIRFAGGHTYVDRSTGHGKRELYLDLSQILDEDHARSIGARFLALSTDSLENLALQGQVRELDQVPGLSYQPGDRIDGDMLHGMTLTLAGEGDVQVTSDLGDERTLRLERLNRQVQRGASGVVSEYSAPKTSGQATGTGTDTTPPEFSQEQATLALSEPWTAPRPYHASWLQVVLTAPGVTTTQVDLMRDATRVGTVALSAGDRKGVAIVNRGYVTGQELRMRTVLAGTGAAGLTASVIGTMI